MLMRSFIRPAAVASLSLAVTTVFAFSLSDLSNQDASSGLKAALEKGSIAAVGKPSLAIFLSSSILTIIFRNSRSFRITRTSIEMRALTAPSSEWCAGWIAGFG